MILLEKLGIPVTVPYFESTHNIGRESIRRDFRRGEAFANILFSIFFISVFLLIPEVFCGVFDQGKECITVFNISFIETTWCAVVAIWALGREPIFVQLFTHLEEVFICVICFGLALDSIDALARTLWVKKQ